MYYSNFLYGLLKWSGGSLYKNIKYYSINLEYPDSRIDFIFVVKIKIPVCVGTIYLLRNYILYDRNWPRPGAPKKASRIIASWSAVRGIRGTVQPHSIPGPDRDTILSMLTVLCYERINYDEASVDCSSASR